MSASAHKRHGSQRKQGKEGKTMIQTELIHVNGKAVQGLYIKEPGGEGHPNMLLLLCEKGYIMCGYLNQAAAEKFGDAAAVVSGSCFEEILANEVKSVTPAAEALGVKVGMTGAEAVSRLNG